MASSGRYSRFPAVNRDVSVEDAADADALLAQAKAEVADDSSNDAGQTYEDYLAQAAVRFEESDTAAYLKAFEASEGSESDNSEAHGDNGDVPDVAAMTVDEVVAYVEANPDQRDAVLAEEARGQNRKTLFKRLNG